MNYKELNHTIPPLETSVDALLEQKIAIGADPEKARLLSEREAERNSLIIGKMKAGLSLEMAKTCAANQVKRNQEVREGQGRFAPQQRMPLLVSIHPAEIKPEQVSGATAV